MLKDSLIAQRLAEVTEELESQFAIWGRDKDMSQSPISLPLNALLVQLKRESDQVISSIQKNTRHTIKWEVLGQSLVQNRNPGNDTDVPGTHTRTRDMDISVPAVTSADQYLLDTIHRYIEILQFYHKMQLAIDQYNELVQSRDYYSRLRGSVWKYTVIPFQFWNRGFEFKTFKAMFTAKTLKVQDLVNVADIIATPTRLINFQLDHLSKKLQSDIDALLVSTGRQLTDFENRKSDTAETSGSGVSGATNPALESNPDVALDTIFCKIDAMSQLSYKLDPEICIPPWYQRQWLQLSVTAVYGPYLLKKLADNGQSLWRLMSNGVYEFMSGLWENWIWAPLMQIWDTIRFDSADLYVTTRDNLTSELNSLIRMIVEFLRDRSSNGANLDVDTLTHQIMDGDLHEFMTIYESQIETPLKSIVFDNMTRSLLIQLQKVKVDGSMAMNGINKLLKSQQLLFSIVSLLPALLIIYGIRNVALNTISSGVQWAKDVDGTKFQINRSLNEVERLLNLSEHVMDDTSQDEKMKSVALLHLEIASLKMVMVNYLPKNYKSIWIRDCNDLGDYTSSNETKLNVINRIHHMYGKYI